MENEILFKGKIGDLDVVIRYLNSSDAKAMVDYINTISKEKTYITYQGEQMSLEEEQKYLDSQLEKIKNGKTVQLLIFVKDELVGLSSIDMKKTIKSHVGNFGISIAKEYRGKGLGKKLMELVVEESKRKLKDLKIIYLEVFGVNKNAYEMYKKFGFIESGKIPGDISYKEDYVDDVQMYMKVK